MSQHFFAGVQCIVLQDSQVLLGKRYKTAGEGTWALPGGHVEFSESPVETGRRELLEETGLIVSEAEILDAFLTYTTSTPYVHIPIVFHGANGVPQVVDGECFSALEFFPLDQLPSPLFTPTEVALTQFKNRRPTAIFDSAKKIKYFRLDMLSILPDENRNRGYTILFVSKHNTVEIVRTWGRRGSRQGWQTRVDSYSTLTDATSAVESLIRTRIKHGYLLAGASGDIEANWLASVFSEDVVHFQQKKLTELIATNPKFRSAFLRDIEQLALTADFIHER
jgi:8-oxo-dGTP diphosphatase